MEYVDLKKSDFRKDLLNSKIEVFEKIEISKNDLYKNKNGVVWHENNKEISTNGNYYEVIKIEETANSNTVYLLNDKSENELFASFYSIQNKKNEPVLHFVKLLLNLTYVQALDVSFDESSVIENVKPVYNLSFYSSQYADKKIKPPRF